MIYANIRGYPVDDKFPAKIDILDERAYIDQLRKQNVEQPPAKFAVGDFIKYDKKVYRIASFNYKCYSCIEIGKDFIGSQMNYFLIGPTNSHAQDLGRDIDIVRMLFL